MIDPIGSDQLPGPPRQLPEPGFGLEVGAGVVVFRLHWGGQPAAAEATSTGQVPL